MAFRFIFGSHVLLAGKHRCECSDVRESVHGRPTPGATPPSTHYVLYVQRKKNPFMVRKIPGEGWLLIWGGIREVGKH